jgi:hypothetical protein
MSNNLRQYLVDAYENRHTSLLPKKLPADTPIQIDDQDDSDKLNEFCNIFCIVKTKDSFTLEMIGAFPITSDIADLAEIYNGQADPLNGRLNLNLNIYQIEVLMDLADKIRKTSFMGNAINSAWLTISSRTISSLYRFVRIIKEYQNLISKRKNTISFTAIK